MLICFAPNHVCCICMFTFCPQESSLRCQIVASSLSVDFVGVLIVTLASLRFAPSITSYSHLSLHHTYIHFCSVPVKLFFVVGSLYCSSHPSESKIVPNIFFSVIL